MTTTVSETGSAQKRDLRPRSAILRGASLLIVVGLLCCACFLAGRFIERQSKDSGAAVPASPPVVASEETLVTPANPDETKCQEIAKLYGQVSDMNWQLVTPSQEFDAGKIDANALRQRTAEPEGKILRLCTRMYELASEIESRDTREKAMNFAAAVLQRHRGLSLMIEGATRDNQSQIAEGAKLFEDGRNKTIAAAIAFAGSDNPQAANLKRLHDACEPGEK